MCTSEVKLLSRVQCNLMDCSLPGSSVHGIFQARVLEWVAISFSRVSSQPRDQTRVSHTAGRRLPSEPPGKHLRTQFSALKSIPTVVQPSPPSISRTPFIVTNCSVHALTKHWLCVPRPQPLETTIRLAVCLNFTTLQTSYKWSHTLLFSLELT